LQQYAIMLEKKAAAFLKILVGYESLGLLPLSEL